MKGKIPVSIYIGSKAYRDESMPSESMSMMVDGTLEIIGETISLIYDEANEEGEEHVSMLFSGDMLTINRTGEFSSQMCFSMGMRSEGEYHTPCGDIELGIFCNRLEYDITENGGKVSVSYQLDMNGQFAAMHSVEMMVSLCNEKLS